MKRKAAGLLSFALAAALVAPVPGSAAAGQASAPAQPAPFDPQARLPGPQLREDLLALRRLLEEDHPGLYRYSSKAEVAVAFDRAMRSIPENAGIFDFDRIVTGVLSVVRDGHTNAYLPNAARNYLSGPAPMLPLRVTLLRGAAYVLQSPGGIVPAGARLLAIDGVPTATIVATIASHLSGDGDIMSGKRARISANFALYYRLFVSRPDRFRIAFRDRGGAVRRIVLPAMPASALQALPSGLSAAADAAASPFRYEPLGIPHAARLTIETFAPPPVEQGGQDFSAFLAATFARIRRDGIEDLLIDLRGNDGGAGYGPLLFSYLAKRPFTVFDRAETASATFPTLRRYSHLGDAFQQEFVRFLAPEGNGRYALTAGSSLIATAPAPQADRYTGRLWLLIDGETFSSAAEFCTLVQSHRRGRFIGTETGGAYHGNSSGEIVVATLPHSGLRITIPLVMFTMAGGDPSNPRRGIIPGYPFEPSIEGLLTRPDPILDHARAVIRAGRGATPASG